MSGVLVLLAPEHVRSIQEARDKLRRLADLGVDVGLIVDDLTEILDRARLERQHSVRADRMEPQPKDDGYHALMADVYDIREGK